MNHLTLNELNDEWDAFHEASQDEINALLHSLQTTQPCLLAFIFEVDEGILSEEEQEILVYLSLFLWKLLGLTSPPRLTLSEETFYEAFKENRNLEEQLSESTEQEFLNVVEQLANDSAHPDVMRFIAQQVNPIEEIDIELSDVILVILKTLVDVLTE
ncbi:MAG: hypothetical protein AABZ14_05905 [Candidatus Margulisiibacteriota bacterium]